MASTTDTRIPQDKLSHVSGRTDSALLTDSVAQALIRTADRLPDQEAVVFCESGERWTWREFAQRTDALAHALLKLGLKPGDRIGIWSPNRPEWLLAQFATARTGLVLVNINPAYRLGELEYALNKVSCSALITAERFKSSDYLQMLRDLAPELACSEPGNLQAARLPALKTIIKAGDAIEPGMFCFGSLVADQAGQPGEPLDKIMQGLNPTDPINIQFTSGTTGLPKGATLSHRNIVNNAYFVTGAMDFTDQDRLCIPVPFYHCFGMVMGTLGCVTRGAAMIIPSEGFDPDLTLKAVSAEKCTAVYGVPTMFVAMLAHADFEQFDLSRLRTGIMAGAPCPVEVMKKVQAKMNMREVTIAYGMTETSPVSFQSSTDDPLDKRVSSVGRIHPHVEVKIVNEQGRIVPVGEQGELCTRGYSVMLGYWDDQAQTDASIDADHWMHTGDLATIDPQGYCNITGRVKDMIVRGGENVYPREVEEYLYRMDGIAQVQVFGIPDEKFGEAVCTWIVKEEGATLTEDDVREFCRSQISHFKVPAVIQFVDEIPMTVTGKPQKFVMRKAVVEALGLREIATA
ncbi:MAG: AMP-binding protein [Burkholderiaceae bacterium]